MFRNVGELSIIFSSSYRLKFMRSLMSLMLYDFTSISDHMLLLRSHRIFKSLQFVTLHNLSAPSSRVPLMQSNHIEPMRLIRKLLYKLSGLLRLESRAATAAESSETLSDDFAVDIM